MKLLPGFSFSFQRSDGPLKEIFRILNFERLRPRWIPLLDAALAVA